MGSAPLRRGFFLSAYLTVDGTVVRGYDLPMDPIERDELNYRRTEKATATLMRQREEKAADLLVERGWTGLVTPEGEPYVHTESRPAKKT